MSSEGSSSPNGAGAPRLWAEPGSWGRPPAPDPATSLSNGRASGRRVTSCGAAARTRWRRWASRCGWSEVRRPRGPGAARPGAGGALSALPWPSGPRGLLSGLNSLPWVCPLREVPARSCQAGGHRAFRRGGRVCGGRGCEQRLVRGLRCPLRGSRAGS